MKQKLKRPRTTQHLPEDKNEENEESKKHGDIV